MASYEHWHDAAQHVATATGATREDLWFRTGYGEGLAVFEGRVNAVQQPIARILNPLEYQRARSRGDLEELTHLFLSRAGEFTSDPALHNHELTMSKTQTEPTVYCVVAEHLIWHGKRQVQGATLEIVPRLKADHSKLALHLNKGWLRVATPEDRQHALTLVGESSASLRQQPVAAPTTATAAALPGQVQMVALDKIRPDPTQPRKTFTTEAMKELVESIKAQGVEQAILVRPVNRDGESFLEIVYGERRWRASKEAGLTEIPAKVRELTDGEAAEKQGIENLARADLSPLEVAAQYRKLIDLVGVERVMELTGQAKNTIYGKLKLLDLPEDGIKAVQSDKLQASVGELIGRQEPELRAEALKRVLKPEPDYMNDYGRDRSKTVTFKEAEKIIDKIKEERREAQLRKQAASEAEGKGMAVLNEEESRSICHYSGGISPSCGYVGATEKCPRDPNGRTWRQVMKGQAGVKEYASIRWVYNSKSFSTTALYKRDEVNPVLKKLGLWSAEGSAKSKELEAQRKKKEKHGRDFEQMQNQLDALSAQAASTHLSAVLRVALTALVKNCPESCFHAAKRRLLIKAEEKTYATIGQAQKRLRELVQAANVKVLCELVGDLAAISLAADNVYFADGIKTVAALLGLDGVPDGRESADIRTDAEEDALEDAA